MKKLLLIKTNIKMSVDYKSIALPTELKGHERFFNSI